MLHLCQEVEVEITEEEEVTVAVAMVLLLGQGMALLLAKGITVEHPTLADMTGPHEEVGEIATAEGKAVIDLPGTLMISRKLIPVSV